MMQQPEMTPQVFSQTMGQLKRRIAQVQGETQQMSADTMTDTLNQIMQMVNQLFQQGTQKDKAIQVIQSKLDKCYNAHPELKIAEEQKAKQDAEKSKKGQARKV